MASRQPTIRTLPSRRSIVAAALAFGAALALAACSGPPPATYDLSAPRESVRAGHLSGALAIAEPTAILPVNSDRIVIRTGADSVAYLSGAQWADRLPRLVQTRLIESFENAGLVGRVGRPGMTAAYSLVTELRRFEVDVTRNEAVIEISARLVTDRAGSVVAAQVFSATSPAPATQDGQAAIALDAALGDAMRRILVWTTARI